MDDLQFALEEARAGDGTVVGKRFAGEDLAELGDDDLSGIEFEDVVFESCSFAGAFARRASFEDCELVACDLANADLRTSFWRRTRLRDCRATGTDCYESVFYAVTVESSRFDFANLAESKLERTTLREVTLTESSLSHLRLRGKLVLENCDLTRAELYGTLLRGVDLSSCEIAGIRFSEGVRELRGAKIAPEQAVLLVGLLGVTVVD